jgi:hypothetical protein
MQRPPDDRLVPGGRAVARQGLRAISISILFLDQCSGDLLADLPEAKQPLRRGG